MKKIIIVLLIVAFGVGIIIWLSNGSQETIGVSQNVERPTETDDSRYNDPSGFSFDRISGYEIRTVTDGASKTLLFEKGGAAGTGFQMLVSYYDEPAAGFSAARIKKDLPDLVMKNIREFDVVGGRGVSFDSELGKEIWFVVGESLYQITAPAGEGASAQKVVDTFKI